MNVYALSASITLDIEDYKEKLKEAGVQTEEFGKKADDSGQKAGAFGDVLAANLASEAIINGLKKVSSAIVDIGKASFNAYADYEQLSQGSQLMYGDAYDYIAEKARAAYKTVQISQNDYLRQANGLATSLKGSLNGNTRAAAELADKIITAEADIVAATGNTQEAVQNAFNGIIRNNYTMLDNLQMGITPTREGFQTLIDQVNEWNAENGKLTNYTIDNASDAYNALVDYVKQQGWANTAAKEGADTITGNINTVKSAWENLLIAVASGESEKVEDATDDLFTTISNAKDRILPVIGEIGEGFVSAFGEAHDKIANTNTVTGILITIAESLAIGLGTVTVATKLWAAATKLASGIINSGGFGTAVGIVSMMAAGFKLATEKSKEFVASLYQIDEISFQSVMVAIRDITSEMEDMQDYEDDWSRDDMQYYAALSKRKSQLMDTLKTIDKDAWKSLNDGTAAPDELLASWKTANDEATAYAKSREADAQSFIEATESFSASVEQIMSDYWDTYNSIYEGLFNASTLFTQTMTASKFTSNQVHNTLSKNTEFYETYAENLQYVQEMAEKTGTDITGLLQIINSMSTADAAGLLATIKGEINSKGTYNEETLDENATAVLQRYNEELERYQQAVNDISEPLAKAMTGVQESLNQALDDYSTAVEAFDMGGEAIIAAQNTIEALATGINSGSGQVLASMSTLANQMKSRLKTSFDNFVLTIKAVVDVAYGGNTPGAKSGLDNVPYDNYLIRLHQGEKVLTAEEAAAYRTGEGGRGITINQYISTPEVSAVELAAATEAYFTQARWT